MTIFFLTRHASHGLMDTVLVGRMPGVKLDANGREQARRIAAQLAARRITAVHSSPQPRARETAAYIAAEAGIAIEIVDAIDEIDVGDWTGRPFASLTEDRLWRLWNSARSTARPLRGESMQELQARVVQHLNEVSVIHPAGRIAAVTHAEVIRAAVLHVLNMPLDDFWRIEIAPASISAVIIENGRPGLASLNEAVAA